jgi:hypothetical protein
MELRHVLNKKPAAGVVAAAVVIALCFYFILRQSSGVGASSGLKAYFSDDDGKTWFKDEFTRPFPFDHGGQPAYRAQIFRCGGTTFCGYLEALPDKSREAIEALPPNWEARYAAMQSDSDQIMVKRPGDAKWVHNRQAQYEKIRKPVCPDGSSSEPEPVNPNLE